ncbi:MAG: hypothetical protein ACI4B5_05210 [Bacteroidaceae bacterium]
MMRSNRFLLCVLCVCLSMQMTARRYTLLPKGHADRTMEVRRLLDRMQCGDTLMMQTGEYHFHDADALPMLLYPSNNTGGMKRVVFPIVGKRGLTIDGQGSVLCFHGQTFPFALLESSQLTLRNFTLTTAYPAAVQFRMTECDAEGFVVQMGRETGYQVDGQGNVEFSLGGCSVRSSDGRISMHALQSMCITYLMTPDAKGDKDEFPASFIGVRATDLGRHMLRFRYYGDTHPKSTASPYGVGQPVVLNLAEKRLQIACFMDGCEQVQVEDVAIRRFGGMGFVAQRSGNLSFDRVDVWPNEGEDVSVTADVFQCINCFGRVGICNSRAGYSLDDVINIHGNYLEVERSGGYSLTLRAKHLQHEAFFPYRQGDSIEIVNQRTRQPIARARVRGMVPNDTDRYLCVLDVDILTDSIPVGALVENITLCPDVEIRNNRFAHFPHIRLSGRGRIVVADNDISNCCTALVGNDLAQYWYEAGRLSQISVLGNRFSDCNALGGQYVMTFGVSGWGEDAPKIHQKVLLRGNIYDGKSIPCHAEGVNELVNED